eukprot:Skav208403  [mRNA]  locus=scaffold1179:279920:285624:- [translate_table: standard]
MDPALIAFSGVELGLRMRTKFKGHIGTASQGHDDWTIDIKHLTRLRAEDRNLSTSREFEGPEDEVGIQSMVSRNSTQLRSFLDKFFENSESETLQEPAKRQQRHWLLQRARSSASFTAVPLEECNREWKPTDWQSEQLRLEHMLTLAERWRAGL